MNAYGRGCDLRRTPTMTAKAPEEKEFRDTISKVMNRTMIRISYLFVVINRSRRGNCHCSRALPHKMVDI